MQGAGAAVTAIGTGGRRYVQAFIADEDVPFPVLLDEDGVAAEIAAVRSVGAGTMLNPRAWGAGLRSLTGGHRQHRTGRRPQQLGATFVIGPGNHVRYADYEDFAGDHADLDEILAVLREA